MRSVYRTYYRDDTPEIELTFDVGGGALVGRIVAGFVAVGVPVNGFGCVTGVLPGGSVGAGRVEFVGVLPIGKRMYALMSFTSIGGCGGCSGWGMGIGLLGLGVKLSSVVVSVVSFTGGVKGTATGGGGGRGIGGKSGGGI
jgi:hypothetical protein